MRNRAVVKGSDGVEIELHGGGILRIVDGKLVESWNSWDWMPLLTALGVSDETAFVEAVSKRATAQKEAPE